MKIPDRRYLAWGAGFAALSVLPVLTGFTTFGWEFSEIAGFAGLLVCLALCGCPVRPRESTPPALLSLGHHEILGWIALGTAALHFLWALVADHAVITYLKLTSPLYQLAGIVAFVMIAILVVSSLPSSRRRLWRSHRNFQATHIAFACILTVLLAVHVLTAGRYTGGYGRRLLYIAVAVGGLAMLLRRRRNTGTMPRETAVARRLAFGRHSTLIAGIIATAMLAIGTLISARTGLALREPMLDNEQMLPLNFDHSKHTAINCLACHHNYADGSGLDACVHCHRSRSANLKVGAEARFHSFCFDCHRSPEPQWQHHGPVSGCTSCHQTPTAN